MVERWRLRRRARVARAAGHDIDIAEMRRAGARFAIDAFAIGAAIGLLLYMLGRIEGFAFAVVAVHQPRAFVNMRVAGEDEVDAALLKDGQKDRAHIVHPPLAVAVLVRIVRALGVRRMMEE